MPETEGTKGTIESWEDNFCKPLEALGLAKLVKDGSGKGSADYVKVYNIFVGAGLGVLPIAWRFHYDERPGAKSHLRISDFGMETIYKSLTVAGALRKLNMKVSNGDKYDIEKLRDVMAEALVIVEKRKQNVEKEI